ncbi:hypothetical protein OEZ85_012225 [Tetradesmus obliquus]|uniref:Uncharacterized protein n=2 Tax=Tetradesmus obliquus TaxID=3088 RepID=A0A383WBN4_TETOB|nr:hypothetical protein OEZ85_012225 [Tetradesmus obliquus]|eukprot:jgi/Sobl393_1/11136/SZX74643.1
MFADESEREQFFEVAKAQAQKDFQEDPTNAHALVRWGGALLELAHFKQGSDADKCISDAIAKLEQALSIDPERTDAEWCLGNAYTSMGFLAADRKTALQHFNKAEDYFKHCKEKEPSNETYKKALEMCKKAPEYYDEIQSQLQQAQAAGAVSGGGSGKKGGEANEFWWDVAGWVTLGAIIVGVLMLSKGGSPAKA